MLWIVLLVGALGALAVLGVLGWSLFGIWFAVWVVLLLGALAVLGAIAWRLFRKALVLGGELATASELLSRAVEQVERLGAATDPVPAVFADPNQLRQERERARRRRARGSRRTMRASRAGG